MEKREVFEKVFVTSRLVMFGTLTKLYVSYSLNCFAAGFFFSKLNFHRENKGNYRLSIVYSDSKFAESWNLFFFFFFIKYIIANYEYDFNVFDFFPHRISYVSWRVKLFCTGFGIRTSELKKKKSLVSKFLSNKIFFFFFYYICRIYREKIKYIHRFNTVRVFCWFPGILIRALQWR